MERVHTGITTYAADNHLNSNTPRQKQPLIDLVKVSVLIKLYTQQK